MLHQGQWSHLLSPSSSCYATTCRLPKSLSLGILLSWHVHNQWVGCLFWPDALVSCQLRFWPNLSNKISVQIFKLSEEKLIFHLIINQITALFICPGLPFIQDDKKRRLLISLNHVSVRHSMHHRQVLKAGEQRSFLVLHDIYRFQIGKFMFLFKKGFPPDTFKEIFLLRCHIHRYNTRQYNSFYLFPCRTNIRQFAISFEGPKLFNSFNQKFRRPESISLFKSKLRSFLLNGLLLIWTCCFMFSACVCLIVYLLFNLNVLIN